MFKIFSLEKPVNEIVHKMTIIQGDSLSKKKNVNTQAKMLKGI